ncbi:MAG: LacI family DNA-binding transcriptional regulator [Propionicimonas sp.]
MPLTSADVAKRAGVSRSTVSYVLNGHGDRFAPATREAVERAVAELGYRPQAAARTLVRGESDIVLLVLPIAASGRIEEAVDALTEALAEKGLLLLMRSATASRDTFESLVTTVRPRAVVAFADLNDAERALLMALGVRTIETARASSRPGGSNWRMGRMQAEHLLARGFERIAYARLAEAGDDVLLAAREQGVRDACRAAGVPEPVVITLVLRADADLDAVSSLRAGTGLACYNDDTAAAALGAAHVIGARVPHELGLIGLDDSPIATQTHPRLTTIGYDITTTMRRVADVVAGNGGIDDVEPDDLTLIQGGST